MKVKHKQFLSLAHLTVLKTAMGLWMSEGWLEISVAIQAVDCNPVCNVMMRITHQAW